MGGGAVSASAASSLVARLLGRWTSRPCSKVMWFSNTFFDDLLVCSAD